MVSEHKKIDKYKNELISIFTNGKKRMDDFQNIHVSEFMRVLLSHFLVKKQFNADDEKKIKEFLRQIKPKTEGDQVHSTVFFLEIAKLQKGLQFLSAKPSNFNSHINNLEQKRLDGNHGYAISNDAALGAQQQAKKAQQNAEMELDKAKAEIEKLLQNAKTHADKMNALEKEKNQATTAIDEAVALRAQIDETNEQLGRKKQELEKHSRNIENIRAQKEKDVDAVKAKLQEIKRKRKVRWANEETELGQLREKTNKTKQLQKLQKEIDDAKEKLEHSQIRVIKTEEYEKMIQEMQENLAVKKRELRRLQGEKTEEIDAVRAELRNLQKITENQTTEYDENVREMKANLAEKEMELRRLQGEKTDETKQLQGEIKQLKQDKQQFEDEKAKEVDKLSVQLEKQEEDKKEIETELKELKEEKLFSELDSVKLETTIYLMNQAKQEKESISAEIASLKNTINNLKKETNANKANKATKNNNIANLQAKLKQAQQTEAEKNKSISNLTQTLEKEKANALASTAEHEQNIARLNAKMNKLEASITENQAAMGALRDANNANIKAKNAEIQAKNANIKAKNENIVKLKANLERAKAATQEAATLASEKNANIAKLTTKLEEKNAIIAKFKEKNAIIQAKDDELLPQILELENYLEEEESRYKTMTDTKNMEIERLQGELKAEKDKSVPCVDGVKNLLDRVFRVTGVAKTYFDKKTIKQIYDGEDKEKYGLVDVIRHKFPTKQAYGNGERAAKFSNDSGKNKSVTQSKFLKEYIGYLKADLNKIVKNGTNPSQQNARILTPETKPTDQAIGGAGSKVAWAANANAKRSNSTGAAGPKQAWPALWRAKRKNSTDQAKGGAGRKGATPENQLTNSERADVNEKVNELLRRLSEGENVNELLRLYAEQSPANANAIVKQLTESQRAGVNGEYNELLRVIDEHAKRVVKQQSAKEKFESSKQRLAALWNPGKRSTTQPMNVRVQTRNNNNQKNFIEAAEAAHRRQ